MFEGSERSLHARARTRAFIRAAGCLALLLLWSAPAQAGPTVAVLPVQTRDVQAPALLDDLLVSEVQERGLATVTPAELRSRLAGAVDLADCWEPDCLADVARRAGAAEALAVRIAKAGSRSLLSVRRVAATGAVLAIRTRLVPASPDALVDALPALTADAYAAAPPPAVPPAAAPPVAPASTAASPPDTEPADARRIRLGVNVVSEQMNDDISDTPAEGLVDTSSYGYQIDLTLPSDEGSVMRTFHVEKYLSLRFLKFVSRGEEPDFPDMQYAESLQAIGVLYGSRYYLSADLRGFALGWYAGGGMLSTKGYTWTNGFTPEPYEEDLTVPLAAIEFLYKLQFGWFYIEPNLLIATNSDSSNPYGPEVLPIVVVGAEF